MRRRTALAALASLLAACAGGTLDARGPGRARRLPSPITPANVLAVLPADTIGVVGVNLAPIRKSSLWHAYVQPLLSRPDVAVPLAMMTRDCGFDPIESIDWLAIGMGSLDQHKDDMSAVVHVRFDAAALAGCATRVGASSGKHVEVETHDGITGIGIDGSVVYLAWLDGHTLFVTEASSAGNRASLVAELARTGTGTPRPEVAAMLGEIDTSAHAWLAVYEPQGLSGSPSSPSAYEGPIASGVALQVSLPAAMTLRLVARFAGQDGAGVAYDTITRKLSPLAHQAGLDEFADGIALTRRGHDLVMTLDWPEAQVQRFVDKYGPLFWPLIFQLASQMHKD